jgi:sensor histidine kinase YesM
MGIDTYKSIGDMGAKINPNGGEHAILERMKKAAEPFSRLKIQAKFFLSHMLVVLFLLLSVSIVLFGALRKIIRQNAEEFSSEFVRQEATIVDYRARDLENFSFSISNDPRFQRTVGGFDAALASEHPLLIQDILNTVNRHTALDEFIRGYGIVSRRHIYLLVDKEKSDFHLGTGEATGDADVDLILESLRRSGNKTGWFPHSSDKRRVYFARTIVDVDSFATLGIFIMKIDANYFQPAMRDNSLVDPEAVVFVEDEEGNLLFTNRQESKPDGSMTGYAAMATFSLTSQPIFHFSDNAFVVSGFVTRQKRWRLVSVIPLANLLRYEGAVRLAILAVCGISLLVSSLLAYGLASGITKNIKELERSMREIEKGNFSVNVTPHTLDEVGLLGLRFNIMANKISELVHTVYEERLAKQRMEFQALLAQINPHFLYNTLGSIKWLAHKKKQGKIEDMITALIELLRFSVNGKEFSLLKEELRYIDNYLNLQKHRFEDRFRVLYEVDDAVLDLRIPRFVLQPLVENALYHGVQLSRSDGLIRIRAFRSNAGKLILEVEDNGEGFKEEDILNADPPAGSRIGIKNVRERLRLHFGERGEIKFITSEGMGTTARIELPIIQEDWGIHV